MWRRWRDLNPRALFRRLPHFEGNKTEKFFCQLSLPFKKVHEKSSYFRNLITKITWSHELLQEAKNRLGNNWESAHRRALMVRRLQNWPPEARCCVIKRKCDSTELWTDPPEPLAAQGVPPFRYIGTWMEHLLVKFENGYCRSFLEKFWVNHKSCGITDF